MHDSNATTKLYARRLASAFLPSQRIPQRFSLSLLALFPICPRNPLHSKYFLPAELNFRLLAFDRYPSIHDNRLLYRTVLEFRDETRVHRVDVARIVLLKHSAG